MTDVTIEERLRAAGFGPLLGGDRWWRDGVLVDVSGAELTRWDGEAFVPFTLDDDAHQDGLW